MSLQTYATKDGSFPVQGNGSGTGWNYYYGKFATNPAGPWEVNIGNQELNGTYDMMGNVWQWTETPASFPYAVGTPRWLRGGSFYFDSVRLQSSFHSGNFPTTVMSDIGFRVASVFEPSTLALLGMGGIGLIVWAWRRGKANRILVCLIALLASTAGLAQAVTIDLVPVGNINNVADSSTSYGAVDHAYTIGKYEVTAG
jgi:hypothetical protein